MTTPKHKVKCEIVMMKRELIYIIALIAFLIFTIVFYRRYRAIYEKEKVSAVRETAVKVRPLPAEKIEEEVLPPPVPEEEKIP